MKTFSFTTLSDHNYLDRGIALYESISKFLDNYNLYYLCLDEYTFEKLKSIGDPNLVPCLLSEEFEGNEDFDKLLNENKYAPVGLTEKQYERLKVFPGFSEFHFALGSFFTNHIMETRNPYQLLYVDADILFYCSPKLIFDSVDGCSIGIIRHRHNKIGCIAGGYNVGVVYFRGDEVGRRCLRWWRDVVLNKNNEWHKKFGTCGDQKYLELFEKLFGNVKILDDDIGHGAPWNFHLYKYYADKTKIRWGDIIQDLVFVHFSHFDCNEKSYSVARKVEWKLHKPAKKYYDEYAKIIRDVRERYEL